MLTRPHDVVEEAAPAIDQDIPLEHYQSAIRALITCRHILAKAEQDLLAISVSPAVTASMMQSAKLTIHGLECAVVERAMLRYPTMAFPLNHLPLNSGEIDDRGCRALYQRPEAGDPPLHP